MLFTIILSFTLRSWPQNGYFSHFIQAIFFYVFTFTYDTYVHMIGNIVRNFGDLGRSGSESEKHNDYDIMTLQLCLN